MKFAALKVGDKVWVRTGWHREHEKGRLEEVTDVKPRSKGFFIYKDRFDMADGRQTNCRMGSPTECWLSEQDWLDEVARCKAWRQLSSFFGGRPPAGFSRQIIVAMAMNIFGETI